MASNTDEFEERKAPKHSLLIGCAGWSIPKEHSDCFPAEGTHLARYAHRFTAVEINSSFYRPHRPATYSKWTSSVPPAFRFSVKMPREVTHERRLVDMEDVLDRFQNEVMNLGEKLGPLLVQLPPSLSFSADIAERFLIALRLRFNGLIALEPRHVSWFDGKADRLMKKYRVSRVAADPCVTEVGSTPGGWEGLVYYRLHGSPKVYYSSYSSEYLETLSKRLMVAAHSANVWCIFDNTAEGEAMVNAFDLVGRIQTS